LNGTQINADDQDQKTNTTKKIRKFKMPNWPLKANINKVTAEEIVRISQIVTSKS